MNNGDGSRVFNIDDGTSIANIDRLDQRPDAHRRRRDLHATRGGAVFRAQNLTVTDSTISGNSARRLRASQGRRWYFHPSGELTVTGSTISGNSAHSQPWRAIEAGIATLTITLTARSTGTRPAPLVAAASYSRGNADHHRQHDQRQFGHRPRCSPDRRGERPMAAVLTSYKAPVMVTDSTISGNSANQDGGGIYCYSGYVGDYPQHDQQQHRPYDGGGIKPIFSSGTTLIVTDSTISGNSATRTGGGIDIGSGPTTSTVIGSFDPSATRPPTAVASPMSATSRLWAARSAAIQSAALREASST